MLEESRLISEHMLGFTNHPGRHAEETATAETLPFGLVLVVRILMRFQRR